MDNLHVRLKIFSKSYGEVYFFLFSKFLGGESVDEMKSSSSQHFNHNCQFYNILIEIHIKEHPKSHID